MDLASSTAQSGFFLQDNMMRQSSFFLWDCFFKTYFGDASHPDLALIEIRSPTDGDSLRHDYPNNVRYTGIGFIPGNGIDIVINDPYQIPLDNHSADVVVAPIDLEQFEFFWLAFLEILRVLKPGGLCYLASPMNGPIHGWLVDSRRSFADLGRVLVDWAKRNGEDALLLESFTTPVSSGSINEDTNRRYSVCVILKDSRYRERYPERMVHAMTELCNGYSSERPEPLNSQDIRTDSAIESSQYGELYSLRTALSLREKGISDLLKIVSDRDVRISALKRNVGELDKRIAELDQARQERDARLEEAQRQVAALQGEIAEIRASRSWKLTSPYRATGTLVRRSIGATGALVRHSVGALAGTGILIRTASRLLLLLPAYEYYGGLSGLLRALRENTRPFAAVIENHNRLRQSLMGRSRPYRMAVFLSFSLAVQLLDKGSVTRFLKDCFRSQAPGSLRQRLLYTVPGAPGVRPARMARAPDLPVSVVPAGSVAVSPRRLTPSPRRILVADDRLHRSESLSSSSHSTVALLKDLREIGFDVVFLPLDMVSTPQQEAELREAGIEVVARSGTHSHSAQYIADYGGAYGIFYLIGVDAAETLLPIARQVAPAARIIFHAPGPGLLRGPWVDDTHANDERTLDERFERERALVMMRRADRVVVTSPGEAIRLLRAELPKVPVSLYPAFDVPAVDEGPVSDSLALGKARSSAIANRACLLRLLNETGALPFDLLSAYCRNGGPGPLEASPRGTDLAVSVIIPARDRWAEVHACLSSISRTMAGSEVGFEVILADQGSKDETGLAGEVFPGLRVFSSPSPLGFVGACNRAAATAQGRYILFLSPDTVVLPGWIEALYRTLEDDPTVALAGSRVLSPDGTIRDAGGALFRDGSGFAAGAGSPRNTAIFDMPREVDYVSAASMLVRADFWKTVGGFDEGLGSDRIANAGLGMEARARGYRVIYQPRSEVIRTVKPAAKGEASTGNLEKFRKKWAGVLDEDHLQPSEEHLAIANAERTAPTSVRKRRATGHLNVLYFSPFPSHPSNHGNQSTIQQFARRFQTLGHKVHFALLRSGNYGPEDEQAMRAAWDTFDILPNKHPLGADGSTIPFDGWYEEGLGENVQELCYRYDIDIVFCSYVFHSKLLEFVPAHMLKVIDTHDKMGDRYDMLRKNGQPLEFFSCTPEEEGAYLRRADVVVARRAEEARYFDSVTGHQTAIVVPHVEDPCFIEKPFDGLRNVGIVASANRINLAIVRECLDAIDRRLDGRDCPFFIHVAGQVRDMVPSLPRREAAVFGRPWVKMHGFVPDIADFYRSMDAVVSPVTMGTGINVKTVQAMAYGMPLLTTAWGCKGIETDHLLHNHENLDQLAESLFRLEADPSDLGRLARISRERYTRFYDDAMSGLRSIFEHKKLTDNKNVPGSGTSTTPLIVSQDTLVSGISNALQEYYRNGDRRYCVSPSDMNRIGTESGDPVAYIQDFFSREQPSDEDFVIFRAFNQKDSTILDIGANWGYSVHSIWAFSPSAKVVSFEPTIGYRESLQKIKDLYPDKFEFRIYGLGSGEGRPTFVVPVLNGKALTALTSCHTPEDDRHFELLAKNILEYVRRDMPGVHEFAFSILEFGAPIRRLDDLLTEEPQLIGTSRLEAIKIDVGGFEPAVLQGAEKTLRAWRPLLMVENGNRHTDAEYMEDLGYVYGERTGLVIQPVQGFASAVNGFFIHRKNLARYISAGICDPDSDWGFRDARTARASST